MIIGYNMGMLKVVVNRFYMLLCYEVLHYISCGGIHPMGIQLYANLSMVIIVGKKMVTDNQLIPSSV